MMDNDKFSEQEDGGVDDSERLQFLGRQSMGRSPVNQSFRQRPVDADAARSGKQDGVEQAHRLAVLNNQRNPNSSRKISGNDGKNGGMTDE